MIDLGIHMARKDNLHLLKIRFPGLKVYFRPDMSNDDDTTYVLESPALGKAIPFSLPSDATLRFDAPILDGQFADFYARHKQRERHHVK